MAVRVRLDLADLARVRFALSPLGETIASLVLLHDEPVPDNLHRPWRRRVGTALSGGDRDLLLRLVPPPDQCIPDYLTPPPATTRPALDRQLATIRATSPARVRTDLTHAYGPVDVPDAYQPWHERPVESLLDTTTATLGRYWEDAVAPHWTPVRDVLEADLLYRARRLAESGLAGLLSDLHPQLRFDGDSLHIGTGCTSVTSDGARGLVFVPSVFLWPRLALGGAPDAPIVIAYPARGVGETWSVEPAPRGGPLARVLGECRARLLADLHEPRATDELARRHGLSPSTVSYHVSALHVAGLLVRRRAGHRVLYRRTHLGDLLVWGARSGEPTPPAWPTQSA